MSPATGITIPFVHGNTAVLAVWVWAVNALELDFYIELELELELI